MSTLHWADENGPICRLYATTTQAAGTQEGVTCLRCRRTLGLPVDARPLGRRKGKGIDWESIPDLFTAPVREIAARLGCSHVAVIYGRKRVTSPPLSLRVRRLVEADPDLGKLSDTEIAARYETTRAVVERVRHRLGIERRESREQYDFDNEPLGAEPDAVIAKRMGCAPTTVWHARKRRGIAPAGGGR